MSDQQAIPQALTIDDASGVAREMDAEEWAATILPARAAAKLLPVDILRYE